jgi:AbrB family looped-hinge helix DNA binding protein
MAKQAMEEVDLTIVSDKGQVVIPANIRNKLGIKPRSKLLVYSVEDSIIFKKLTLPDIRKEMEKLWKEVDKKVAKYGEMSEEEIQAVIEEYRREKRSRPKGA